MLLLLMQIYLLIFIRGSVSFQLLPNIEPGKITVPEKNIVPEKNVPEDACLNFTGLSIKYGKPAEQYQVITEDGYVLTLFHMPGKNEPVLLFHGYTDSADTYIIRGENSLSITLANAGYDVWVGNVRGNKYSRRHTHLSPEDKEFWNFSTHEMGYYDLPAVIDFVLEKTGREQLMAIGHSQGNAIFYVMGSTRPEYNEKVKLLIALAPIYLINHIRPPLNTLAELGPVINDLLLVFGIEELFNDYGAISTLFKLFCPVIPLNREICKVGAQFLIGWNPKEYESEFIDVIVAHHPTSVSRKSFWHICQIFRDKKFQQFDYGVEGNLKKYKSKTPPEYDMSKVTMRVELFTAQNDKISTVEDVEILSKKLPNNNYRLINYKKMNHMDFVWGKNMKKYLYPLIFEALETKSN